MYVVFVVRRSTVVGAFALLLHILMFYFATDYQNVPDQQSLDAGTVALTIALTIAIHMLAHQTERMRFDD